MKANAVPLLALFENKQRLEVPLFQRRYVWNQEQQWAPLWDDIQHKFVEYLQGRKDAPVHFLGAMVLDQKQTPSTHVVRRQVIDGQQRLTTLQIFLAAFRDFCLEHGIDELGKECGNFTLNSGMMADREVEQFKVWPTQQDRTAFIDVLLSSSRAELLKRHPLKRAKYARRYDLRPLMVESYFYFHDQLTEFFLGSAGEPPLGATAPLADRLAEAFQALKNALQVVVIDLEDGDDPQVIFETLNARGEPLLPADLLRNFIFLRATRQGANPEALYAKYWAGFEEEFWREAVRQGRLIRPRSDLFMQHFLASQQAVEIPIKHLYVEYRYWIERKGPFDGVEQELAVLARYRGHFSRLSRPKAEDPVKRLADVLTRFDVGTAYPVLLFLLDSQLSDEQWTTITRIVESYLLRRQYCGLTTKNYNKVFLGLLRKLREGPVNSHVVFAYFEELQGDSTKWPSDGEFLVAWVTGHAYQLFSPARLAYVLGRLDEAMTDRRAERVQLLEALTIEHVMPQSWVANWPLRDGAMGLAGADYHSAPIDDPRRVATDKRNAAVHRIGNLTLLSDRLNPAVSNGPWAIKRAKMREISKLAMNQALAENEVWDEEAISKRALVLFEIAKQLWPRSIAAA